MPRYRCDFGAVFAMVLLVAASGCSDPGEQTDAVSQVDSAETTRIDIVGTAKKLYSQHDEEIVIRDFFQDRRDGFFLDVGCAWPQKGSTTFYLERHLGWHGIGVDAVAEYGPQWAKTRPASKFANFLVIDEVKEDVTFYKAKWWGVSSMHKEQVEKMIGEKYDEITVPSITIDKLLEAAEVEKIDFLSMDIEGAQMQALKGFDIKRWKPDLVCIEAYQPDRPKMLAWFAERGYERLDHYLKTDFINWYFAPKKN